MQFLLRSHLTPNPAAAAPLIPSVPVVPVGLNTGLTGSRTTSSLIFIAG
jgi:hypothetical protein